MLAPVIVYGVSLKFPNRYTSKALVLADQQRISDSYVKPVVTEGLMERSDGDAGADPEPQPAGAPDPAIWPVSEVRGSGDGGSLSGPHAGDISVVPVRSVIQSREGDLPGFYINFTADNPRLAQQVCAEITSMFIAEDQHYREQTAQGTSSFLGSQLADAKSKLDEQDAKLAAFKRKNIGDLPEEMDKNLNLLASLNTQLEVVTQTLNRQQQDKPTHESILAQQLADWQAVDEANNPHPQTVEQELSAKENATPIARIALHQ